MLTVKQVAESLHRHPITVYRWCYSGELKSLKLGGVRRIEEKELEKFIHSKQETTKHGVKAGSRQTHTLKHSVDEAATDCQPTPPKKEKNKEGG